MIFSHRELIALHFKQYDINHYHNNKLDIELTTIEEVVLFMLIGGYTQQEIGELLEVSRSRILRIVGDNLCIKFKLKLHSTKVLIEKAVSSGFAHSIPNYFTKTVNMINDNQKPLDDLNNTKNVYDSFST